MRRLTMGRRTFLAMALSIGTGTLLTGCSSGGTIPFGGGGDGGGSGGGGGGGQVARGAATGVLLKDPVSGALVRASRLRSSPPAATPLAGATVRVAGGPEGRTDADGRFLLENIPAGQRVLTVEGGGLAAPVAVPLTVVGDATVDVGLPPVSREQALDRARAALAAAGISDPSRPTILSPQQPLPAGVLVVPRLDAARIEAGVAGANTLARASWFFFCDDAVGQPFAHEVQYVYVDCETGETTTETRTSWPTFNAQHFYGRADRHAASPDLVQPGVEAARAAPVPIAPPSAPPVSRTRAESDGKLYALLVFGFSEAERQQIDGKAIPGRAGIPAAVGREEYVAWDNGDGSTWLRDRVIAASRALVAEAGSRDFLYIDINSHGGLTSSGEYVMWLPSPDQTWFDGLIAREQEMLRPQEMGLEQAVSCRMLIVAGTCSAGNWIDYARQSLDVPGKEVTVFCAAPSQRVSWGNLKNGFGTENSRFFREEVGKEGADTGQAGLLAAAERATARSQTYFHDTILKDERFKDREVSYATHWSRTPAEGEDCDVNIVPLAMEVAVDQFINFEVKVSNRPANAPPVRIEVSTTLGDLSTASNGAGPRVTLTEKVTSVAFNSPDEGVATITAEAFERGADGSERSLGKATAKITVQDATVSFVTGTPTYGFFPYQFGSQGRWGYFSIPYVVVKKIPNGVRYELVENPFPELEQDEEFRQPQKINGSMVSFTAITDHIPEGEYWHVVSGFGAASGGSYASEAAARAEYDKDLSSPEEQAKLARLLASKWKWKVTTSP